jgi:TIR domain
MAHDVFISHSTLDKPAADAVCHGLEAQGIRCWMAPRDQIPGKPYGQQITEAIRDASVMVLIFSENVNNSQAVLNEINLAAAANVTIVPFRLAKVEFNSELNYYLGRTHWLDAFPPPLAPHVDALAATVRRNLPEAGAAAAPIRPTLQPSATPHPAPPPPPPHPRTNYMPLAIVGVVLAFVLIIVMLGLHGGKPSPAAEQATNTIAQAVANAIQEGAKNDDQPPPLPPGVNAPSPEVGQPTDQDDDQGPGNAVGASNAPPPQHRGFFDRILHRSDQRHGADR